MRKPTGSLYLYPLERAASSTQPSFSVTAKSTFRIAIARSSCANSIAAPAGSRKICCRARTGDAPIFFDSVTQIVMPQWHKGRVALIGDACGCLTLLAGQGSHMAMAAGFVLAQELARHDDYAAAFAAYQNVLKPSIDKKQQDAARFAGLLVPGANSRPWLRRLTLRLLFSKRVAALRPDLVRDAERSAGLSVISALSGGLPPATCGRGRDKTALAAARFPSWPLPR